jgi:diacylglycerol kinase (ATP)
MDIRRKRNFLYSVRQAIRGCAMLFGTERNAKIHLVAFISVLIAGFYFKIDKTEWMIILLASGAVISAEALNTAIEGTIDIAHPEHGEKAGRIKDIAAGAVLIVTCTAIACGVIIFFPKIAVLIL